MEELDVVVCGGGTAGAAAAIKAGNMQAHTLVIDQMSALGGTQSMGWVTPMMPNYRQGKQLSRGLNITIQNLHAQLSPKTDFENAQVWYNPVALSLALDKLADEANVIRMYGAYISHVETQNNQIESISCQTKSGLLKVKAKIFVDATGDADIAYLAGCPTVGGDEHGQHQPMTLRFTIGNVSTQACLEFFNEVAWPKNINFFSVGFAEAKDSMLSKLVAKAIHEQVLEEEDLGYFQFFTVLGRPRELAFNCPRLVGFDPLDPISLSKAYIEGRKKIFRIYHFCQKYLPGFQDSYVSVIAPLMGIRESRRIVGEYILTEQDHQECKKFEDVIARNRYPIDIHLASGGVTLKKLPDHDFHEIPYRCLIPKNIENLIVAGRCISATFAAQSSIRIQPVCRAMGEAAGAAAALCAQLRIKPSLLPYEKLHPHLDLSLD